jgi:tripartite-type tricarboxylate transporter receptor subunit TctC
MIRSLIAAVVIGVAVHGQALAQWPEREINVIVNYGAGGVTDVATRILTKHMEVKLGKPIIVQNRAGAQATLGPAYVAKQPADGYTVGVVTFSSVAIMPHLMNVPYTIDDFEFVGMYGRFQYGLAVRTDSPYRTVADLVAAAKKAPKPIFFGAPGAPNNIAFFELARKTGAKFEQVSYKSGAETVTALISGQVEAIIQTPSEIVPHVTSGRLRLLASVSPTRWPDRPDMPTMKEQGFDVEIDSWMGLAVPKGTAKNVVAKLESTLIDAVKSEEVITGLRNMGIDPMALTGAQYRQKVQDGYAEIGQQLKRAGITKQQ